MLLLCSGMLLLAESSFQSSDLRLQIPALLFEDGLLRGYLSEPVFPILNNTFLVVNSGALFNFVPMLVSSSDSFFGATTVAI